MPRKVALKVDVYAIVRRAVEEGAAYGYRRAFKYTDRPSEEQAVEAIVDGVMSALCEVLRFD